MCIVTISRGSSPPLLMRDGAFQERALVWTRTTHADLIARLRKARALHVSDMRAVILDSTGDMSVLHGERLDARLLDGVRRDKG
ncbi:YetF domain-containing protein [Primorskyibacter sp. 2E107]|uniref:YetF domain-containing protein n=1 Tax=Primorskyibacter sp. 2E107 TaxID=3403458 RepID=UPI003AF9528B